jgi:ATP-dependent protease HslVU (ClpYQ) peptidase subunit
MTVVVAYTTPTESWIVTDSAASMEDGSAIFEALTPKGIRHAGNGAIGAAGSWRIINLISTFKNKRCTPAQIVKLLKELKGEEEAVKGTDIIMVWPNRPITAVNSDLSVIEYSREFMAIGEGAPYALGYLEGCHEIGLDQLIEAVEVATKYVPSVRGPITSIHCKV